MKKSLTSTSLTIAETTIPMLQGGEGRPLLFLNGGDAFHMSSPFLELLARNYRVYAPKHPGYGGAPAAEHILSVNDLAVFYLELMEHLDLNDTILVGASFGGWVALELAIRSCARIERIALIDSVGLKFGDPTHPDIADIYTLRPEVLKTLQYANAKACEPDYAAMSTDAVRTVVEDRTGEARYAWRPYMHNPVLRRWLWRVRRPTLVLWGAQDGIVDADYGRRLASLLPQSTFHMIDGAGHYPHVEKPEVVVEHLSRFACNAHVGSLAKSPTA